MYTSAILLVNLSFFMRNSLTENNSIQNVSRDVSCPVEEFLALISVLTSGVKLTPEQHKSLQLLTHLLTRYIHNDNKTIFLEDEQLHTQTDAGRLFSSIYVRGLGYWKKGDPVYICHITRAILKIVSKS